MKTFLVATAVLASWLAVPARVHAAPPDAESDASALVADAARAYDQNQLDEALLLLARAYKLSPRPSILFNQAQVFRAKKVCDAAVFAYQRFIDTTTPDDPNRERALQRLAEMKACADQPKAPAEAPPAGAPTASPTATTAPAPVQLTIADPAPVAPPPAVVTAQTSPSPADDAGRVRRRAMRVSGWTLLGVGVVAAAASAVLAWRAHNIQEELNTDLSKPSLGDAPVSLTNDQRSLDEEGSRDAALARWFGAAAALAGGGGAALLIVSRPPPATGSAAGSAASHAATALIGWSGTF